MCSPNCDSHWSFVRGVVRCRSWCGAYKGCIDRETSISARPTPDANGIMSPGKRADPGLAVPLILLSWRAPERLEETATVPCPVIFGEVRTRWRRTAGTLYGRRAKSAHHRVWPDGQAPDRSAAATERSPPVPADTHAAGASCARPQSKSQAVSRRIAAIDPAKHLSLLRRHEAPRPLILIDCCTNNTPRCT